MTDPQDQDIRAALDAGYVGRALELTLDRLGGAVFGYLLKLTGDRALANDAFQVFSIRLWRSLPTFRWESALKSWVFRIARNTGYRVLEDPFLKKGIHLETVEERQMIASLHRSATREWQKTTQKNRLWDAVASLPAGERELLTLRLGQRMKWAEISALVELPAATLRKRFERTKRRLKEKMEKDAPT